MWVNPLCFNTNFTETVQKSGLIQLDSTPLGACNEAELRYSEIPYANCIHLKAALTCRKNVMGVYLWGTSVRDACPLHVLHVPVLIDSQTIPRCMSSKSENPQNGDAEAIPYSCSRRRALPKQIDMYSRLRVYHSYPKLVTTLGEIRCIALKAT